MKKHWKIATVVAGIVIIISIIVGLLAANGVFSGTSKITICTKMDYQGDIGPCVEKKTIEIVSTPENPNDCPANTEPVYDTVGGFVGIRFVGCTKK